MKTSDVLRLSARMRADVARGLVAHGGRARRAEAAAILAKHDPLSQARRIHGRLEYVREDEGLAPVVPMSLPDVLEKVGQTMADIQDMIEGVGSLHDPKHVLEQLRVAFLSMSAVRHEVEGRCGLTGL